MMFPWTGSAKTLRGDCKMICVFASDNECERWSEEDKEKIKENVDRAWEWIVEKASEYDVEINPQIEFLNEDEDVTCDYIRDLDSEKGSFDVFEDMIQQLGYESTTEFYETFKKEGVNSHFVFFVNKDGRSYQTTLNVQHADASLEINVNFLCGVGTIIHEALHAYGAVDLYNVIGTADGEKAARYASKHFPNEVMLSSGDDLDALEISPFNAFMVGWHKEYDDTYLKLLPKDCRPHFQEIMDNIENFDEEGNLIIETEDEVAVYVSEDGYEFRRYRINSSESIYLWKEFRPDDDTDGEGIPYQELFLHNEDTTYRLMGINKPDIVDIPLEGGTVYAIMDDEDQKEYCEVTLQE
jgi:hypothetical protein